MEDRVARLIEVAKAFHHLGWTSFGGPAAHVVYFRNAFVLRRRWLGESSYAELLALVQLLPGPASTQLAVILGIGRAGLLGGLLAWLGFVLPSALLMLAFALLVLHVGADGNLAAAAWLHGLKVVVVGVVAQAVLAMGRRLCPDLPRFGIAVGGTALALALPGSIGQLGVIGLGTLIGAAALRGELNRGPESLSFDRLSRRTGAVCMVLFLGLLLGLPLLRVLWPSMGIALFDGFYRAGALVFGGGHVILPLLRAEVVEPGWVSSELFLAGYGAAQALPGPLFTFAAYLGAVIGGPLGPLGGAVIGLLALFLPSALLVLGVLPFWTSLRARPGMAGALAGVGAAVVGLLAAVLIDPIWGSAIGGPLDVALAAVAFALLAWGRVPPWLVVIGCAAVGWALTVLGPP